MSTVKVAELFDETPTTEIAKVEPPGKTEKTFISSDPEKFPDQ